MKLFSNVGRKIQILAIVMFFLEAIGSFIAGIVLWSEIDVVIGAPILFGGPIAAILINWFVYAFGQISEDLSIIRDSNIGNFAAVKKSLDILNGKIASNGNSANSIGKKAAIKSDELPDL